MEFPPKPEEPLESDCCGCGCSVCVFDIYQRDLAAWEAECKEIDLGEPEIKAGIASDEQLSRSQFQLFELQSIVCHTIDTAIYRFVVPLGKKLDMNVGQHFILRSFLGGRIVTRSYTPVDHGMKWFEVLIKLYADGVMSNCISKWSIGDMVEWRGPFGNFAYSTNQHKHIVMLAAGTGLAPMLQVIKAIIDNEQDETAVKLFYTCKRAKDILMRDLLDQYKQFWNFKVTFFLTEVEEDDDKQFLKYGDEIIYSRINEDLLYQHLPRESTRILVCGTKSFDKDMINYCLNIGFQEEDIFRF